MADFKNTPDYHGYIEIDPNAALIGFSTLFFGTRIYVRAFMTKTLGWENCLLSRELALFHLRLVSRHR